MCVLPTTLLDAKIVMGKRRLSEINKHLFNRTAHAVQTRIAPERFSVSESPPHLR